MATAATREEIFDKVQSTLVDALGVDAEEVSGDSTLTGDLGAESIDFLDIVFRLEKNFGIKIPRGDLFPENVLSDPQFVSNGKVTEKGLDELRVRMPWANFDRIKDNPNVQDLFTVDMIVNYVESKINPGN
jgi:acyl carrier protein